MQEEREVNECTPRDSGPPSGPLTRLKAERVQFELAEMPGWSLTPDGRAICHTFRFEGYSGSLLFTYLASALGLEVAHLPAMTISGETVVCHLTSHEAGGVTELDLELARRISRLL